MQPLLQPTVVFCGNGTVEWNEQCDDQRLCAGTLIRSCQQCRVVMCPPAPPPAPPGCEPHADALEGQRCQPENVTCATAYCGRTVTCTCGVLAIEDAGTEDDAGTPSSSFVTAWLCATTAGPTCDP
jgi:hypothetical protein